MQDVFMDIPLYMMLLISVGIFFLSHVYVQNYNVNISSLRNYKCYLLTI